jgi:hypothetical protein
MIDRRYQSAGNDDSGRRLAVLFTALAVWNPSRVVLRRCRNAIYRMRRLRRRLLAAGIPTQRPGHRPD